MKINQKDFRNKKGQAALEFLTTYGWAILVILVMVAALSSFGILSPERFLPDRCQISTEFACDEFVIYDNGTVNVIVRNQLGQDIDFLNISRTIIAAEQYDADDSNCTIVNAGDGSDLASSPVSGGQSINIACTPVGGVDNLPGVGSKATIDMQFDYENIGATIPKKLNVEVYSGVQES